MNDTGTTYAPCLKVMVLKLCSLLSVRNADIKGQGVPYTAAWGESLASGTLDQLVKIKQTTNNMVYRYIQEYRATSQTIAIHQPVTT